MLAYSYFAASPVVNPSSVQAIAVIGQTCVESTQIVFSTSPRQALKPAGQLD